MSEEHIVEVWHLASGSYGATCTCGWVTSMRARRADVTYAAELHAATVTIVEVEQPIGDAAPRSAMRQHVELRTAMEHDDAGALRFRARCACGWSSEPVGAEHVTLLWERHAEASPPGAPPQQHP